jgi:uncharacterized membrane protein YqjE
VNAPYDRTRSFAVLLRDLAHGSADLLRGEIKLARLELTQVATSVGRGTALVAFGAAMLLLGALSLVAGVILLAGDQWLPRDLYWLAALIVMIVTGGLAVGLLKRGLSQLSPSQFMPDQTIETLKEDREWLKRQLTSGATSS